MRTKGKTGLFAATPPSEALRIILSDDVGQETERKDHDQNDEDPIEILILDVRRAHFYAKSIRRVFAEMPLEDARAQGEDRTAELLCSLYGTQDAAAN